MRPPHFHVLGVPVRVELWFWLSGAFVGARYSSLRLAGIWMAILFVSILLHEMGHAMAYRRYGATPSVTLHGLGGVTQASDARHLTSKQRLVVSFAGSVSEMVILGGPAWLLQQAWGPSGYVGIALTWLVYVNVIWALINLAPVWPLDGGLIMDDAIFLFTGQRQRRFVHTTSIVVALILVIYFFSSGLMFGALLFGYKIVVNLGRLGVVGSGSTPSMFELGGGHTPTGSAEAAPRGGKRRQKTRHPASIVEALNHRRTEDALALSASALKSGSRADRVIAMEAVVWAWLQKNRPDRAAEAVKSLTETGPFLEAVLAIESGDDLGGVENLAHALLSHPKHSFAEVAVVHTIASGHVVLLVQTLATIGSPAARGHIVRIDSMLERRELDRERKAIDELV